MSAEKHKSKISTATLAPIIDEAFQLLKSDDFKVHDPFDGLQSKKFKGLVGYSKWSRLLWLQFHKRSPINLRRLFSIEKEINPKGLALLLSGRSFLGKSEDAELLFNLLMDALTVLPSGSAGWGYNFDWQNKVFFIPKFTPTIVNTSFAVHAILDFEEHCEGDISSVEWGKVLSFYVSELYRTGSAENFCFSYTPIDRTKVHNANLLAAGALSRLCKKLGISEYDSLINGAVSYSVSMQNVDGSWVYGDDEVQQWVDSFHTGFNLEALDHVAAANKYQDAESLLNCIEIGKNFYASNFFGPNGEPFYYSNKKYPFDVHSSAQALSYFSDKPEYVEVLHKVLSWAIVNLYDRGSFHYQKTRFYTNKIMYGRWGQAWMIYGLSKVLSRIS